MTHPSSSKTATNWAEILAPRPKWVSPSEYAELKDVSRRTVYRWLATGTLKARKTGNAWRISTHTEPPAY